MSRYRAIFDSKGKAYEFQNGELVWMREDLVNAQAPQRGPTVIGDMEPFRSPIDGSIVSGRAAFREHCTKHNVVPTADLKGLPYRTVNQEYAPTRGERESMKRTIAAVIDSKHY